MTNEDTHIKLKFNTASGDTKTVSYKLDAETRHRLEAWQSGKLMPPTRREIAEWLEKHGGMLDDDGAPALVVAGADGNRIEAGYLEGQPHGAYVETSPHGGRYTARFNHGHLECVDGPAITEIRSDGSRREAWYVQGHLQHEEEFTAPSLAAADPALVPK